MVELASVEVRLSGVGTPTRRVAVGSVSLDGEAGAELLAEVAARVAAGLDPDELVVLRGVLRGGLDGVVPPRSWLRWRCQVDTVGLRSAVHRVVPDGRGLVVMVHPSVHAAPAAHGVALVAAAWAHRDRVRLYEALWNGVTGRGGTRRATAGGDSGARWAAHVLGVDARSGPHEVQRAFRRRLHEVHPDAGGGGGCSVDELVLARRVLLGTGVVRR